MQEVTVVTYCDWPDCAETFKREAGPSTSGQETTTVDMWFNAIGKGRKTQPIKVELCDIHKNLMRDVFIAMQKYDQNKEN